MTEDIIGTVRADNETALSRLGSSKALYAATGGEMVADEVLRAVADDAAGAAAVFEEWAADGEVDEAATRFAAAAEHATSQRDTALGEIDGDYDPALEGPVADHLRGLEGTAARAGALAGWSVVSDETLSQVVGFFVGDADPQTAATFRGVREETEAVQEAALEVLATVDDREAATAAANGVVEVAYDDYVATLEGMGVNPKNVC